MPEREGNSRLSLREARAQSVRSLIHGAHSVLEHASDDYSSLAELQASRKIALCPTTGIEPEWEVAEDLKGLREIDVVICDHVLEYLLEPRNRLLQLKDVLKPRGRLIAIALYDREGFRHVDQVSPAEHFFSWNVQTLGNLLVDCGYEFESGCVKRWPSQSQFAAWSKRFGASTALFLSRFFGTDFEVRIVARSPTT